MVLERREKEIVTILLASELTTISKIAETMHLSSKTISQSLKIIDNYFAGSGVSLIRKPKVGISLVGDRDQLRRPVGGPGPGGLRYRRADRSVTRY